MRLDRLLSNEGLGSRRDVRKLIRAGLVSVDGVVSSDIGQECSGKQVMYQGREILSQETLYLMMNKPAGYITAASDGHAPVVMDLLPLKYIKRRCMPIGRLDKDTTGLLLFTTNGTLAHKLLRPQKQVYKTYQAKLARDVDAKDREMFEKGIDLGDFVTKPATLKSIGSCMAECAICEGKYHQVKRMFSFTGNEVLALKRTAFGSVRLDESLSPGESRALTDEEIRYLLNSVDEGESA